MSSIGKVHLNGSTVLSLNDRFTIMQKQGGSSAPMPRARSRSRSRSRYVPQMAQAAPVAPRITFRNRSLLQQLDHRHKMRVALKLKRKSMNIRPQNVIGVRGRRRLIRPTAALINTANSRRRVRRSNSVAKQIATIKADLIKNVKRVRRLTKTNSTLNLSEQLGVRGRPRLRRNNLIGERAASRSRGRSASRNRVNMTRTNSKQNLRGRSASRQRQGAPIRLNRSNSRLNLRGQGVQQGPPNVQRRQRSQSRTRKNTSMNARLGVRRQNIDGQRRNIVGQRQNIVGQRQNIVGQRQNIVGQRRNIVGQRQNIVGQRQNTVGQRRNIVGQRQNIVGQRQRQGKNSQQGRQPNKLRNVQRGRITKRPNQNARNQIGNGVKQQQKQKQQQQPPQRGRSRSSVRQNLARSQSHTRNATGRRSGIQRGPNQQRPRNQQRGGNQTRGRSQMKNVKREPPKSKEQLDAELDLYMVNTKSSLDQEMSIYTK